VDLRGPNPHDLARSLARAITGPVRQVTAAARRIVAGDMSIPAPVCGPAELAEMATAVNAAVDVVVQAP